MNLVQIIGYIGMVLLLSAYFLVSKNKISSSSFSFQFMNFLGSIGIAMDAFVAGALPAFFLNVVWGGIALIFAIKYFYKKL